MTTWKVLDISADVTEALVIVIMSTFPNKLVVLGTTQLSPEVIVPDRRVSMFVTVILSVGKYNATGNDGRLITTTALSPA